MRGGVFFFGVKKEPKNLWGDASPKPRCALGGVGQGANKKQNAKEFCQFWGQNLFFCVYVFCVA